MNQILIGKNVWRMHVKYAVREKLIGFIELFDNNVRRNVDKLLRINLNNKVNVFGVNV
jgi:hypothetical protein